MTSAWLTRRIVTRESRLHQFQKVPYVGLRMPEQVCSELNRRTVLVGLTHLERLEAESIHIMREAVAESERPVPGVENSTYDSMKWPL
jgi:hypothetical protein